MVDVGNMIDSIYLGRNFTCAGLDGDLKCWGENPYGQLGYGHTDPLGDDEVPSSYGFVDAGAPMSGAGASGDGSHFCALNGTKLRCWGRNDQGQLGYGHTNTIGDDEVPADAGDVPYL